MKPTLTDAVMSFKNSGAGLEQLIERIAVYVYLYPRQRFGWTEDDCGEFFCYFYPKVKRLIARFEYTGRPFEAFLGVTLKWQLKTYATRRSAESMRNRVIASDRFWGDDSAQRDETADHELDEIVEDDPPALSEECRRVLRVRENGRIADASTKRRLLYLVLMSAPTVPNRIVVHAAFLLGCTTEWLYLQIDEIKRRTEHRRLRLERLAEKRNAHFFRMYCLQEQLSGIREEAMRSSIVQRAVREQLRLAETIKEIDRVPVGPTHRDVADVLNVPKGSVDSGLYYLKAAFQQLQSSERIGYAG